MRLAVLSDIHGNLHALRAVLTDLAGQDVQSVVNLGDVIGYGPDPEDCVALVRELAIPTVCGNHEHAMLRPSHKRWFNTTARLAVDVTETLISDASRAWFHTLPKAIVRDGCRFVHGYPPENMHLYLFNIMDDRLTVTFETMAERICFVGHTHDLLWAEWDGHGVRRGELSPGVMDLDPQRSYILNVGSVGQPRDEVDARAKYALYDADAGTLEIRCVDYDRVAVAARIRERGIPETYAARLLRG